MKDNVAGESVSWKMSTRNLRATGKDGREDSHTLASPPIQNVWPVLTKGASSRWNVCKLQAKNYGAIAMFFTSLDSHASTDYNVFYPLKYKFDSNMTLNHTVSYFLTLPMFRFTSDQIDLKNPFVGKGDILINYYYIYKYECHAEPLFCLLWRYR